MSRRLLLSCVLRSCVLLLVTACGDAPEAPQPPLEAPRTLGDPDLVAALREAAAAPRDPSDGGGRAWVARIDPPVPQARGRARIDLGFEVGPRGVAQGGMVFLQVSPFWGWSTPQVTHPDLPGYTLVEGPDGAGLESETLDQQLLGIRATGRALAPGEQLWIRYGVGPARAVVDDYADADARLWIAVDGDGDGTRTVLPDSPSVRIAAGPPARLHLALPTIARPGERVTLRIAVLDASGSRGVDVAGTVHLSEPAQVLALPEQITLSADAGGVVALQAEVIATGVARVSARGPRDLEAISNPLVVTADGPRVLWADLHGHSGLSDGTGTPEDYFAYARDVAGLDVVALTDHDHWGMRPLVRTPEFWQRIRAAVGAAHDPGRFVALLGFEWTSWIHGHRHVLYFTDDGPVIDSVDPAFESPVDLWAALGDRPALTFAHHSAGGPVPTNWDIAPDPRFEPVTEIASVHGSSEAPDSPHYIYSAVPGNSVRDALGRGYRLGFVGSGDSHDGHPGLAQYAAPSGGLAAILAESRTRDSVLAALRARRTYATNGPRILLRAALGTHRMGATVRLTDAGRAQGLDTELYVHVVAPAPLERIDLIRSGAVVAALDLEGKLEATVTRPVTGLVAGEYVYVRVVQRDGGAAWSSPVYVEAP